MKHLFLIILCSAAATLAGAQPHESGYRSSGNPLYWKNRKPDAAYWQQDVHYTIKVAIDETSHTIAGTEVLEYWNNSPDTLTAVYFHLYQNAFVKGSYLHDLERANKVRPQLGRNEAAGHGTDLDNIKADGVAAATELDNTILKVTLAKPLYPGGKTTLSMDFKTWYDRGATRRRMQMYPAWGFMHYNGVQWFPKVCVYDRKFGWDTYQHLNKEFYGDFGSFDVELDFPSNYVVEATGALQNRAAVLPDTLRAKLDIKNFASKPWNEAPSTITPYVKGQRKTWKYHAENVHDFAFTADPSYRIGSTTWNGIECVAIAQEPHASGWQNGAEYVAKIIQTFSNDIGMYQYPKMVAADANDGMEYPMLTLDGGSDPGYRGLLVHEIGHNWFYGMVGSNETYRAAMDEGFTQFLTAWGLNRLDGKYLPAAKPKSWYRRLFYEPTITRDARVFNYYQNMALTQQETPINTHSNDFHDALGHENGYGLVYYKTASMLYNLQYTLGDSLFLAAMQHYFHQWRFAHPYFEDFRASIIQFTHTDLNWFFDQWIETTKPLDYSISSIKKKQCDVFAIRFRRKGEMQMPIDFTVTAKNGAKYNYTIPNTWFSKQTEGTTLPKWYGWGGMRSRYTAAVTIPSGIRSVQIDSSDRLADRVYTDNYRSTGLLKRKQAIRLRFDGGVNTITDRRHYNLFVRPDIWYNPIDGVKAGIHLEGDYMGTLKKVDATFWWNTHAGQTDAYLPTKSEGYYDKYVPFNYTFNFESPVTRDYTRLQVQLNSRMLDGLNYHRGGLNWKPGGKDQLQFYAQTMWRALRYDFDYLLYANEWSSKRARPNASLNLAWTHNYRYMRGNGSYRFSFRAPFLNGNSSAAFNYAYAQLEAVNTNYIKKLEIRTRFFGRYGTGNNIPYESALWLAGANPEQLMEDKYTRSKTFIPEEWQGISRYDVNHFQQGGGLNLRGYAGYFVADERNGEVLIGYKGRSGISGNIEIDVDNYIPLRPRFTRWLHADVYFFGDAGLIELSRYKLPDYWNTTPTTAWSDLRVDAGLGFAFTIRNWGVFEKAKPLTLRVDLPLFINRAPYSNPEYFGLRYVVGINRTF